MRVAFVALAVASWLGCGSSDSTPDAMHDAARPTSQLVLPTESLGPADLGVLVNSDDPQSVAVGEHYMQARGIPPRT